jgi:hypothetical protein
MGYRSLLVKKKKIPIPQTTLNPTIFGIHAVTMREFHVTFLFFLVAILQAGAARQVILIESSMR